jgi:hypothetical protein
MDMFYGASPEIFSKAKSLRSNTTQTENLIWVLVIDRFKNFKYRRKTKGKYILRNNYAYLLDSDIEAVNLTMFVPEPYNIREISACCDGQESSKWSYHRWADCRSQPR